MNNTWLIETGYPSAGGHNEIKIIDVWGTKSTERDFKPISYFQNKRKIQSENENKYNNPNREYRFSAIKEIS